MKQLHFLPILLLFIFVSNYCFGAQSKQAQNHFAIGCQLTGQTGKNHIHLKFSPPALAPVCRAGRINSNFVIANKLSSAGQPSGNEVKVWLWLLLIVVFDVSALIVFLVRKKKRKAYIPNEPEAILPSEGVDLYFGTASKFCQEYTNSALLFGNFRFLRSDGTELSNKFSPLLKELFLLILVHSVGNSKGITTSGIIEKLWPGMPEKNARNNLAVNIGKLRALLGPDFHELMVNHNGYWKIAGDENNNLFYCDYCHCVNILEQKGEFTFDNIQLLIGIIQKGGLLTDLEYEWLDAHKANISNNVIDTLLRFVAKNKANISASLIVTISDTVMLFDMVNEHAMELKCKALVSMGRHSMANDTYARFVREYKTLYDIDFNKSLKSVIE
ncbi:MAG: hypothetical protein JXB34_03230 [Bacteroidales bacterium]|nr:hypothetical protein [Bacteroidales bacterium]